LNLGNPANSEPDPTSCLVMLWLSQDETGFRPTFRITEDVFCAETRGWCEAGAWEILILDMVSEARTMRRTLAMMVPGIDLEVGSTASGEGVIIACRDRTAPLSITINDMRVGSAPIDPPQGSWDYPVAEVAYQAGRVGNALADRAKRLAKRMVRETAGSIGLQEMQDVLLSADPHRVSLGIIDARDIVAEVGEIMDGLDRDDAELDESRITDLIRSEVADLGIDVDAIIEKVAFKAIRDKAVRRAIPAQHAAAV
uniref:hypothetical protein n=1 Tax=Palleronia sp. TaxID=1940284 RepID=UPI0035C850E0